MTQSDGQTSETSETSEVSERGSRRLREATELLRERPEPSPPQTAGRVLGRALARSRPSPVLDAYPPHEGIGVAVAVLVRMVQRWIEDGVPGTAVRDVTVEVDGPALAEVRADVAVVFRTDAHAAADAAADQVDAAIAETLGAPPPDHVTPVRVRVVDVTPGDPRLE